MLKNIKHIFLHLSILFFCSAFISTSERISWEKGRPLQWEDFQGKPDFDDTFRDAVTASALKFTTRCKKDGSIELLVAAEFVKDQSWVKEVARSDYNLGHERLHFDITELYARKYREFIDINKFTCDDKDLIQSKVLEYLEACMNFQTQYDSQTRYSLNKTRQKEWEAKVKSELNELKEFASD